MTEPRWLRPVLLLALCLAALFAVYAWRGSREAKAESEAYRRTNDSLAAQLDQERRRSAILADSGRRLDSARAAALDSLRRTEHRDSIQLAEASASLGAIIRTAQASGDTTPRVPMRSLVEIAAALQECQIQGRLVELTLATDSSDIANLKAQLVEANRQIATLSAEHLVDQRRIRQLTPSWFSRTLSKIGAPVALLIGLVLGRRL